MARLLAQCWCGATEVSVDSADLRAGRTGSCGPRCGPGIPIRFDIPDPDPTPTRKSRKRSINMVRFNPATYDPQTDSTPGYAKPGVLVLARDVDSEGRFTCPCGCLQQPKGKKALFAMGHDIRTRGKLMRAEAAGINVELPFVDDTARSSGPETLTPTEYAARFSTDALDWVADILAGAERARNARKGKGDEEVLRRAAGPQVGDRKVIRVGRWDQDGRVVAVYQDGRELEFEFTTKTGQVRRARQDADGKLHLVKESA